MVHTDALGHNLQSHAVQSVFGEKILGGVENLFHHVGALLGLVGRRGIAAPGTVALAFLKTPSIIGIQRREAMVGRSARHSSSRRCRRWIGGDIRLVR